MMKMNLLKKPAIVLLTLASLAIGYALIAPVSADQANPLALPCTIGACTPVVNPYSKKVEYFACTKCGSETCWIMQSAPCR